MKFYSLLQIILNPANEKEYYKILCQSIVLPRISGIARELHLANTDNLTRYELYQHPTANYTRKAKQVQFV